MAEKLRVGVVGLGVGEQHASYVAEHPDCELVVLYDLDEFKARELAERYGGVKIAASYEEICADSSIDIVSIASYDDDHAAQVVQAIQGGKHLFVEKPLCLNEGELGRIVSLSQAYPESRIVCNLPLRKAPLFLWLRDEIAKGALGDIYAIDGDYLYGRLRKITEGWRKDVQDYSVLEGGGIHMLDLILYLTGQSPKSVSSVGNKIVSKDTSFRYDDYVVSTFQFESGLIARLSANFGCVHPHQHVLKVFGTKATFIFDDCGARLHTKRDPLEDDHYGRVVEGKSLATPIDLAPKPNSKAQMMGDLIENIQGNATKILTYHEFSLMNVCLTAVQAHKTGNTEIIKPLS